MDVIQEYARQYPSIRVYRNERNRGVGFTVSRGLDLATGDYIYFSASDDEVLPGFFEKSLRLLAEYPQAALSCTISEWRDVASGLRWHMAAQMSNKPCYLMPDEMVWLGQRGRLFIDSHSSIMRKAALCEAGGFIPELRWHCDWFATYVTGFRYGICYVPEPLSVVNIHPKSYFQSGSRGAEHREVLNRLLELLASEDCADVAQQIRHSAVLGVFSTPLLPVLMSRSEYRQFLTPRLLLRVLRRRGELLGKRILPSPLARLCLRLLYHHN
jgi:glycosyltransferase involved in cell wall biosynthesis